MSNVVEQLCNQLDIGKGKKPKAKHHLEGRIFPFHTRNPERVKFTDDFSEIVGIIVRCSLGKELILEDTEFTYIDNIMENIEIDNDIVKEEIQGLFEIDFDKMQNTFLLQYLPVNLENKIKKDESRGKELLGYYITKLLRLDENDEWKEYIKKSDTNSLYESLYIESLPRIENGKPSKEVFHFFDQEVILKQFNKDLKQLMSRKKFVLNDLSLLISYYFFYYVLQQCFLLVQTNRNIPELWFAYEKEKVSAGRLAAQRGYKVFNELSKELLVNNDTIDYLNFLSEKHNYLTLEEIVEIPDNQYLLGPNLMQFNNCFADSLGEEYTPKVDMKFQINQLQKYLRINISSETATRYRKSFDEFSGLNFIKNRGRLGYILNATQEFILLFVSIIIGNDEKILLKKLFMEFESRGIFFDKQSKKELISFFEEVNILEKLSDSGDAQYVKSVL